MAMTMVEAFRSFIPPVRIVATDIDTHVLAQAQDGDYAIDRVSRMPAERVKQFFQTGADSGHARVRQELKNMIAFRQLNLLDERWQIGGPFDAIFCRNVMIYFDRPTQYKVLAKFARLLTPDGLLFARHSESFFHAADLFRLRGKTVYELAQKKPGE